MWPKCFGALNLIYYISHIWESSFASCESYIVMITYSNLYRLWWTVFEEWFSFSSSRIKSNLPLVQISTFTVTQLFVGHFWLVMNPISSKKKNKRLSKLKTIILPICIKTIFQLGSLICAEMFSLKFLKSCQQQLSG